MLRELFVAEGSYVGLQLTQATEWLLQSWASKNGVALDDKLHVTLLYSRKRIQFEESDEYYVAVPTGFALYDGALVLELDSLQLQQRHEELMKLGGTHDYPSYKPHVTLQAKPSVKIANLKPVDFGMAFDREYHEQLIL